MTRVKWSSGVITTLIPQQGGISSYWSGTVHMIFHGFLVDESVSTDIDITDALSRAIKLLFNVSASIDITENASIIVPVAPRIAFIAVSRTYNFIAVSRTYNFIAKSRLYSYTSNY